MTKVKEKNELVAFGLRVAAGVMLEEAERLEAVPTEQETYQALVRKGKRRGPYKVKKATRTVYHARKAMQQWSKRDDKWLLENATRSSKAKAKYLGRTERAVEARLCGLRKKAGIKVTGKKPKGDSGGPRLAVANGNKAR